MTLSYRDDCGTKIVVHLENMSIEKIANYMEYVEETLHIPVDTSKMFQQDRRR